MDRLIIGTANQPCFGSVVMSPAVAPQSGANDQFYSTVYHITLNSVVKLRGSRKI